MGMGNACRTLLFALCQTSISDIKGQSVGKFYISASVLLYSTEFGTSSEFWRYSSRRLALLCCCSEGILIKTTLLAKSGEQN